MVSGTTPSLFDLDQPDFAWIGYSLPGVGLLHEDVAVQAVGKDRLAIVLGVVRAKILRTVEIPVTMSTLTARIGCSPSNATYHCQQPEAAGLVARLRRGSRVQVRAHTRWPQAARPSGLICSTEMESRCGDCSPHPPPPNVSIASVTKPC